MSVRNAFATSLLAAWLAAGLVPATASDYAFLVAVQDYDVKQLKPLQFSRNDIVEFQRLLTSSGYDADKVVVMHDDLKSLKALRYAPEAKKIRGELKLLLSTLEADDSIIVAFAGHGVQFEGDQKSYFCPSDADLEDPKHDTLISFAEIYQALEETPARRRLLLVDACRNDPQSQISRSRAQVKLESVTRPQETPTPKGIVALFSCSEGQQAYEWPELKHGIFFYHVLQAWQTAEKELTLDQLVATTKTGTKAFARMKLKALQTPEQRGFFPDVWVLRSGGSRTITNSIGMRLALIPAGEFQMGSPESEEDHRDDEQQHPVKISLPFYLCVYEVTQTEFQSVMGRNPSYFSKGGRGKDKVAGQDTSRCPVEQVSWYDAVEFCNKLSAKDNLKPYYRLANIVRNDDNSIKNASATADDGSGYRLPTEAEWEYACRAGTTTPFHFGTTNNGTEANVDGTVPYGTTEKGRDFERSAIVGSYNPNAFGLFDMHGNVWEWCGDYYDNEYYSKSLESDPRGPSSAAKRVLRGGSWEYRSAWHSRSARRTADLPYARIGTNGFRLARTP